MKEKAKHASVRRAKDTLNQVLLSAFLEHVPDLVYFKDRRSQFVKVSNSLARRLGVDSAEELIGKSDEHFYTNETAHRTKQDE